MDRETVINWLVKNTDTWKDGGDTLESMSDDQLSAVANGHNAVTSNKAILNAAKTPRGLDAAKATEFVVNCLSKPTRNAFPPPKDEEEEMMEEGEGEEEEVPPAAEEEEEEMSSKKKPPYMAANRQTKKGNKPLTVNQWLKVNNAPPALVQIVDNAYKTEARRRSDLVSKLVANVEDEDRRDEMAKYLANKTSQELEMLVELKGGDQYVQNGLGTLFAGAGGGPDFGPLSVQNEEAGGDPLIMPTVNFSEERKRSTRTA